jgi:hypothetical protein
MIHIGVGVPFRPLLHTREDSGVHRIWYDIISEVILKSTLKISPHPSSPQHDMVPSSNDRVDSNLELRAARCILLRCHLSVAGFCRQALVLFSRLSNGNRGTKRPEREADCSPLWATLPLPQYVFIAKLLKRTGTNLPSLFFHQWTDGQKDLCGCPTINTPQRFVLRITGDYDTNPSRINDVRTKVIVTCSSVHCSSCFCLQWKTYDTVLIVGRFFMFWYFSFTLVYYCTL